MKDAYSPEEIKELLKENQELKSLNNVHTFAVAGLTKENEQLKEGLKAISAHHEKLPAIILELKSQLEAGANQYALSEALNAELLEALKESVKLIEALEYAGEPVSESNYQSFIDVIAKAEPK